MFKKDIYKVGITNSNKGEILFQIICYNPSNIKRKIIQSFKEHNIIQKQKYFQGDYKLMINIMFNIIQNDKKDVLNDKLNEELNDKLNDEDEDEDEDEDDEDDEYEVEDEVEDEYEVEEFKEHKLLYEKIYDVFPNYKSDESFGGIKKYIKVILINHEYVIYYINPYLMNNLNKYYVNENDNAFNNYVILCHIINNAQFENLINKKIIYLNKVYDINSNKFINMILNNKLNFTLENYENFKLSLPKLHVNNNIHDKIHQLFYYNIVINDDLYVTSCKSKELTDFECLKIKQSLQIEDYYILYKLNTKFFDYNTYLRKYMPFIIRWNNVKNFYILNCDYEYIGINAKYTEYKGQVYLYNDNYPPLNNKDNFMKMCKEYYNIIEKHSLKTCLNLNENTDKILKIF
jgi:hypothetical protein